MIEPQTDWKPFHEPLRNTLLRTGLIALVVGSVLSWRAGSLARWPAAFLLVLWFSFGGHWVELWFLNWLRPRISARRGVQVTARLLTWCAGGVILFLGMQLTALAVWPGVNLFRFWWLGGLGFIGVELMAHAGMALFRLPTFYNGRG